MWLLDVLTIPQRFTEGAKEISFFKFGLPSPEVRDFYHAELQSWSHTLPAIRRVGNEDFYSKSPCELSKLSVAKRATARYQARALGSWLTAQLLVLRDTLVYGGNADFTYESMFEMKRKKLEKIGRSPSQTEVCEALMESSTRSNEKVDKAAKSGGFTFGWTGWAGYFVETTLVHLFFCMAMLMLYWLSHELYWYLSAPKKVKGNGM